MRERRYASAGELALDLEAWLAGRTVSAREYTWRELFWRAVRANRAIAVTMLVAVLAVLGIFVTDELRVRRERNEARQFARELLVELPQQVKAVRSDLSLLDALTRRATAWLGSDPRALTDDELRDALTAWSALTRLNRDVQRHEALLAGAHQLEVLSTEGLRRAPLDGEFAARQVEAIMRVGDDAADRTDVPRAIAAYRQGWALFSDGPLGALPRVRLARADLADHWGQMLVDRATLGAPTMVEVWRLVEDLAQTGTFEERLAVAGIGGNLASELWCRGEVPRSDEVARRAWAAVAEGCTLETTSPNRCLRPLQQMLTSMAWVRAPIDPALRALARGLEARDREQNPDSFLSLYDNVGYHMEMGELDEALAAAEALDRSQQGAAISGSVLIAAVFLGREDLVEHWRARPGEEPQQAGSVALALWEAEHGRRAEARAWLARVSMDRLCEELPWPVGLALPVPDGLAEGPAIKTFEAALVHGYERGDSAALEAAVRAFGRALE